jgi:hypothetical protein
MAEDAVIYQPVSDPEFPDKWENNGNFSYLPPENRHFE